MNVFLSLFFLLKIFFFIFNIVYIIERVAHPCGSPIKMGRVKLWRKVGGTKVSIVFSPVSTAKGKVPHLAVKIYQRLGMVGRGVCLMMMH